MAETVDNIKTWWWTRKGDLKVETEVLIFAAQEQALRTNSASGIKQFFTANYALFFGELCAKNPELWANYVNYAIFLSKNFLFQFIKLANLLCFYF